jgi:hypothetical protein
MRAWSTRRRSGRRLSYHLTDPVVSEVEPLAHVVKHAAPNQLLDQRGRLGLFETRGPLKERELKLPADDRGRGHEFSAALAQTFEVPLDHLAHALRNGESRPR